MSIQPLTDVGFDRCYKCKKTQDGCWMGKDNKAAFICLRCLTAFLRQMARLKRRYRD